MCVHFPGNGPTEDPQGYPFVCRHRPPRRHPLWHNCAILAQARGRSLRRRVARTSRAPVSRKDPYVDGRPPEWSTSCPRNCPCLLYTSDAADDLLCVDLGGRRIIKKKISTN